MDLSKFHVITTIFNPARYKRRMDLYFKFANHMRECGLNFHTVEVAQRDTPYAIGSAELQLRTHEVLWHKERALNLLIQRLPDDWEYLAWIDADLEFINWRGDHAWYLETIRQLQLYKIVQLFHNCIDLGPNDEVLNVHKGFGYSYQMGFPYGKKYGHFWHPGYAWACRRDAYEGMGGLIDWGILGAGDHHMATAWIGRVKDSIHGKASGPYFDKLYAYERACKNTIRHDVGYVPNTILHFWHGKKRDRRYQDRWDILTKNAFNPSWDLKPASNGLYSLVDHHDQRSIDLKNQIRQYFHARNEDSIDLD